MHFKDQSDYHKNRPRHLPHDPDRAYEFCAGTTISRISRELDARIRSELEYEEVPQSGYLLEPGSVYLLETHELMGSTAFAQLIFGTRATGSSGLFIDVSANLGHVGCVTKWTLELVPVRKMLIFPMQRLGQITFWHLAGDPVLYRGLYSHMQRPLESKSYLDAKG